MHKSRGIHCNLELIKTFIKKDVFVTVEEKYIPASPEDSVIRLFDFRSVILQSEFLDAYAEVFFEKYEKDYPFQVCGLEVTAIPLISAIVMKFQSKGKPLHGFFIRKSRKKTGLLKAVEGVMTDDAVIIVDDIVNSGSSVIRQIEVLKSEKKKIKEVFSILRFRDYTYYTRFKKEGIQFISLFSLDDFRELPGVFNLQKDISHNPILDPFDNEILWRFTSPEPNLFYVLPKSGPVISEGKVYFGSDNGYFFALDLHSGKTFWRYQIPFGSLGKNIFSTPVVYKDTVFFGAYDGNLYALDKNTGKRKWVFMEADWIGSSPCVGEDLNMVYIGLEYGIFKKMGGVSGLDARTGEKIWEFRSNEYTHGSPAYSKKFDVVGCGSNDGIFYVLDAKNGKFYWSFQTEGPIKYAPRFVDEHGLVVVLGHGEIVYVLDTKTGEERSQYKMDFGGYSTPLIIGSKVICTSFDKNVHCFDLFSGMLIWRFNTGARCFSTPELVKGKIYVGSNNGQLFELDPETGKATGIFYAAERIVNKIAYDESTGIFLVPTFANELIALKNKD